MGPTNDGVCNSLVNRSTSCVAERFLRATMGLENLRHVVEFCYALFLHRSKITGSTVDISL